MYNRQTQLPNGFESEVMMPGCRYLSYIWYVYVSNEVEDFGDHFPRSFWGTHLRAATNYAQRYRPSFARGYRHYMCSEVFPGAGKFLFNTPRFFLPAGNKYGKGTSPCDLQAGEYELLQLAGAKTWRRKPLKYLLYNGDTEPPARSSRYAG